MPASHVIGNTSLAFSRAWHSVDARERVLGRLAGKIALTLMGKHKPMYDPAADCGDYVVVKNATQVVTTGDKANQMVYRSHTGYAGGLKEVSFKRMAEKKPDEIIRKAVSGMLPKNRTRKHLLDRLLIFSGDTIPDSIAGNVVKDYTNGDKPEAQATQGWKDSADSSDSLDSLFVGADDLQVPVAPSLVHTSPPVHIPGLHIDNAALSQQMQSRILSHLSFDPPAVTQQVLFGTLPPFVSSVVDHLHARSALYLDTDTHAKLFDQHLPRQCIINVYGYSDDPAAYHLAQHTDLAQFGEGVMILSLGSCIAMRFEKCERDTGSDGDTHNDSSAFEVLLQPGSVVYLTDEARYNWTHGIQARTTDNVIGRGLLRRGIRVGLTIRYYNQSFDT
ncbi:hypothetical protein E3P99_03681 [Wallemia hederae]|uniref:Alpha-ketoglutarate-dependent dioxygenase AlkB-like domain-containing protein n=1 Tax=Wallemia hederae TaxID=1540922 RepID=A0A4T0FE33_9BASI|nr:hypothetical protein E3P99_03681 [Wallemia hederae]